MSLPKKPKKFLFKRGLDVKLLFMCKVKKDYSVYQCTPLSFFNPIHFWGSKLDQSVTFDVTMPTIKLGVYMLTIKD